MPTVFRAFSPLKNKIAAAESAIEAFETELAGATAAIQNASEKRAGLRIVELPKDISRCEAETERFFDQLAHNTAKAGDLKKFFDERIARLEVFLLN